MSERTATLDIGISAPGNKLKLPNPVDELNIAIGRLYGYLSAEAEKGNAVFTTFEARRRDKLKKVAVYATLAFLGTRGFVPPKQEFPIKMEEVINWITSNQDGHMARLAAGDYSRL